MNFRFLIGAGGTGGHLYPALAVLEEIANITGKKPQAFFAGRKDKIEAEVAVREGYEFVPTDVYGINKLLSIKTLLLPMKVRQTIRQLRNLIQENNIQACICTGSYISYSPGIASAKQNIPLFLMESNVNPGKSLKMLTPHAANIFTSFTESKSFFPKDVHNKIILSGNPVRQNISNLPSKKEALKFFNIDEQKPTVLIFGGSLGAYSINQSVEASLKYFAEKNYQIIWQTGKKYDVSAEIPTNVKQMSYIEDMNMAYAASDLVVCRSGATTVAELTATGKPSILIPLPSASNNEQFHNASALEERGAAIILNDKNLSNDLVKLIDWHINDVAKLKRMGTQAKEMEMENAASIVANKIIEKLKS